MKEVDKLAKIIWDYHHLNQKIKKTDCILVFGSHDLRVANRSIDIFFEKYASLIIFSGGFGRVTKDKFKKPEADIFADVAFKRGVPKNNILIENKSTNTGENIQFVKELIQKQGLNIQSFIGVQKPYMERRTYATFKKIWPEKEFIITSPMITFKEYMNDEAYKKMTINIMVGDLQRIKLYYDKGFQIYQEIPDEVWDAYKKLIELGYTKHLIKK